MWSPRQDNSADTQAGGREGDSDLQEGTGGRSGSGWGGERRWGVCVCLAKSSFVLGTGMRVREERSISAPQGWQVLGRLRKS